MAFSQDSMLPTYPSSTETSPTSLSKRRRFTPSSIPIIQCIDNSDILDHTFDSPLMLQLCEQSPTRQEIEAQLLQVGMRVRKSVNDGYKTRAFTPRPFFGAGRLSPELQAALSGNTDDQFSAGGLHNVGSMAMQPVSTATFCGINLAALAHISSDRTSPIEEQKLWTYTTSHKRNFDDESDSDESQEFSMPQTPDEGMPSNYFSIDIDNMCENNSMSQAWAIQTADLLSRKVAKPKSRLRGTQMLFQQQQQTHPLDHYNPWTGMITEEQSAWPAARTPDFFSTIPNNNLQTNDFGEATFLQRREDVDMDCS